MFNIINHSLPLSQEQQQFAADNHNLIYEFLHFKRLDENDFYDVCVFGYLRAVRRYLEIPQLRQQYKFSTIAFKAMNSDVYNQYRYHNRQKRKGPVISIYIPVSYDEDLLLADIIPSDDNTADSALYNQLLESAASVLSMEQRGIFRMKSRGYSNREIAEEYDMPVYSIKEMLASIKGLVYSQLYQEGSPVNV